MSTAFPNRPDPAYRLNSQPVPSELPDAVLCPPTPVALPKPAAPVRRKAKTSRQLTPQKIGVAWEKVRRVVRDLSRQRGPQCPLCRPYGNRIDFQYSAEYRPITLELEGDRIHARIERKTWNVRIVRIKSGGSGYQLRGNIRSATLLLIELLKEARIDKHMQRAKKDRSL